MKLNESWYIILNIYFNIVYDIYNNCINLLIKIFSFLKLYNASYAPPFQPEIPSSKQSKENVMSRIFKRRNIEYTEEFSAYLSIPLSDENTDPLEWWKVNKVQFPNLSWMAQDYLAIPATSVPSEESFSAGKNLITDKRNRLAGKTIRTCMCLRSWWVSLKKE